MTKQAKNLMWCYSGVQILLNLLFRLAISQLVGLILSMQVIVIVSLVGNFYPAMVQKFLSTFVDLAGMDVLYGQETFQWLNISESDPLNQTFESFGMDQMVFLYN